MDLTLLQQIQKGLEEKRQNLSHWLDQAQASEIELATGEPGAGAIEVELAALNTALESAQEGTLDVCEVCHGEIEPALLELDYTTCICLEDVSQAERRRLEAELEFSQAIQQALLPQNPPAPHSLDIATFSRPADYISGDSYDFFKFQNGLDGIMIADAVGHGISAGLLMSSLQAAIRLLAPENDGPAPVLQRLNRLFLHNYKFTTFATVFLASFDPANGWLTYANAGHNPALLYSPGDGALTCLQRTGPAVGLVEVFKSATETVRLKPGDVLLLYTDGVTEAHNPQREEFGLDRLVEVVQQQASGSAEELLHAIRLELGQFLNGLAPEDDTTLVAIKLNQPAAR